MASCSGFVNAGEHRSENTKFSMKEEIEIPLEIIEIILEIFEKRLKISKIQFQISEIVLE